MKSRMLALAAVAAPLVWALMAPQALAGACSTTGVSYSLWVDDPTFSCTIGDKTFSDFTYVASGSNPVDDENVTVTAITGPDIGLQFNAAWTANAGQTTDATIGFDVAVTGGAALIKDTGLAQLSGVNADGSASVAELACAGDGCTPGLIHLLTLDTSTTTKFFDSAIFSLTGALEVEKDISVVGGAAGGTGFATLSQVQDTFSQIPEPASLALFGSALIGFGVIRRRRKSA